MATARNTDAQARALPAPIEVFRAGTHTDASGRRVAISETDLQAIAAAYSPELHEAPIVVGHPGDDAPAYGWVRALRVEGDRLVAEPHQVEPAFAELVREGRFKKVSISLYGPDAPGNPRKGGWYLRHLGFLGAQPPAIKGLKQARFAASEEGVVEFAETWSLSLAARLFRGLREFVLAQFGQEAADKALPAETIEAIAEAVPAEARPVPAFAEPPTAKERPMPDPAADRSAEFAERERALATREQEIAAREQRLAAEARARRAAEDAAFVEGLVKSTRLPVELKPLATRLLAELDTTATVEFAEAGTVTAHAAFRALLERLPARVAFGEHAGGDGPVSADPNDRAAIEAAADALIKQHAERGQTLSFREAVNLVTREKAA